MEGIDPGGPSRALVRAQGRTQEARNVAGLESKSSDCESISQTCFCLSGLTSGSSGYRHRRGGRPGQVQGRHFVKGQSAFASTSKLIRSSTANYASCLIVASAAHRAGAQIVPAIRVEDVSRPIPHPLQT